jgi:hypothetical protein
MKNRFNIITVILLTLLVSCGGSSDDGPGGGDISIKLNINNPKALFINKSSSGSGKYMPDQPGDLYQITTEDLMEKVDFIDTSNSDEKIEAQISMMRKISDDYIVVQLEMYVGDEYKNYILVVDLESGSTYDLGDHGSIFDWSNALYDDPIAIGKNIYFIEADTLKKINFETLEIVPLSNPEVYVASGLLQVTGNYVLTHFYNVSESNWDTVLIEENMSAPTFLESEDKTYLEEFNSTISDELDFSLFGYISDCSGDLYDVDIVYDSSTNASTARLISFGVDVSDQLTASTTDIVTFSGTGAPDDDSSATNRAFDFRWSNSLSISDSYRMLVLNYGYVYVESNTSCDGFDASAKEVDLSFLFDTDGHPIFKFYDSAQKVCWKDGEDINYYDLVNGTGSGDVQTETITGLTGIYTVGDKIIYTKLVGLTGSETYEFNPAGTDTLLSSSEMSIDTILEF